MDVKKQRALLAASVAGILATITAGAASPQASAHEDANEETAPCYGINKCKGVGACGGKGHSCAGQNACKGQGYIELEKEDCLRIEGGRLTVEPEAS